MGEWVGRGGAYRIAWRRLRRPPERSPAFLRSAPSARVYLQPFCGDRAVLGRREVRCGKLDKLSPAGCSLEPAPMSAPDGTAELEAKTLMRQHLIFFYEADRDGTQGRCAPLVWTLHAPNSVCTASLLRWQATGSWTLTSLWLPFQSLYDSEMRRRSCAYGSNSPIR